MKILNLIFQTSTGVVLDVTDKDQDQDFATNLSLLNSDVSHSVPNHGWLCLTAELCLMVIILIGNSLTIAAIRTTPSLQTLTNSSVGSVTFKFFIKIQVFSLWNHFCLENCPVGCRFLHIQKAQNCIKTIPENWPNYSDYEDRVAIRLLFCRFVASLAVADLLVGLAMPYHAYSLLIPDCLQWSTLVLWGIFFSFLRTLAGWFVEQTFLLTGFEFNCDGRFCLWHWLLRLQCNSKLYTKAFIQQKNNTC